MTGCGGGKSNEKLKSGGVGRPADPFSAEPGIVSVYRPAGSGWLNSTDIVGADTGPLGTALRTMRLGVTRVPLDPVTRTPFVIAAPSVTSTRLTFSTSGMSC